MENQVKEEKKVVVGEYCKHEDCALYLNHRGIHCTKGGTYFREVSPYKRNK